MSYINLGTRNKPTIWAWVGALTFLKTKMPTGTGFHFSTHICVGEGEANQHCHEEAEMNRNTQTMIHEFEAGTYTNRFFQELRSVYLSSYGRLEKEVSGLTVGSLSNEELGDVLVRGSLYMADTFLPMLMGFHTRYLEDYFTEAVRDVIGEREDLAETQSLLLYVPHLTLAQQEEEAVYRIEEKYKDAYSAIDRASFDAFCTLPSIQESLNQLVVDFGWFHMEYDKVPLKQGEYVEYLWSKLSDVSVRRPPSEAREQTIAAQQAFFTRYPNASHLRDLTTVLQEFAYVLDESKVIAVKSIFTLTPLIEEAAKRVGITAKECTYLSSEEIRDWLVDGARIDTTLPMKRERYRSLILKNGVVTILEGNEARKAVRPYFETDRDLADSVKGKTGYPGVVRGKVVVVHSINDRNKFSRGDILVTHDGTAELTYFLKEAAAIVTDEGGIICHATIIAREMRTPCIVGTRNSTKLLHDGDYVEVDAGQGTVRVLK